MSDAQSAAPASTDPTPAIDPTATPATVPDLSPGAVPPPPPPVDNAYVVDGAERFATDVEQAAGEVESLAGAAADAAHPAEEFLAKIEAIAIRYGGDVMTEIRHLCAEVKSVL